jgi:hypothetical protein
MAPEWHYSMGLLARMKIILILVYHDFSWLPRKLCIDCRAYMRIMEA